MKSNSDSGRRERQDWGIVLIILLIGFLCVILAGQQALRLSPSWKLNANMESGIDPNSNFLTDKPAGFIEPVDANILTQPAWVRVFLTPGAKFSTGTPRPIAAANTKAASTEPTTAVPITNTIPVNTNTAVPTNTFVWLPLPATNTPKPPKPNTPTNTSAPPPVVLPSADLQIILSSSATWYAPGTPFTYTIEVRNIVPGSSEVTGVTVTDTFPTQVSLTSTTWSCAAVPPASCTPNGLGNISDVVNLPFGSSVTYTVTVVFNAGTSGNLVNSASVGGAGYTELNTADNTSPFLTASPGVDLRITKSSTGPNPYTASGPVSYTIDVTNNSPFTVNGVIVTDTFSGQINPGSILWTCAPTPGTTCTLNGSGNINDTINMLPGSTVQYTVSGTTVAGAVGPLPNTANVILPGGFVETNPGNETTSTSTAGPAGGGPGGQINIGPPNNSWDTLGPPFPTVVTMAITPIIANGDGTYDFVYYERLVPAAPVPPPPAHVELDWVQIQISSDGVTWYTVFNFGDGTEDPNTIINGQCPGEADNCFILPGNMYNNTGVAINIDTIVPPGSYPWIQIISPASPGGDGAEVDAIQVLP